MLVDGRRARDEEENLRALCPWTERLGFARRQRKRYFVDFRRKDGSRILREASPGSDRRARPERRDLPHSSEELFVEGELHEHQGYESSSREGRRDGELAEYERAQV